MSKIGFTWDRRWERVVALSGIGEDLADGAMGRTVTWRALLFSRGHGDAKDGCGAVHARVGGCAGGGGSRTEGGARCHMFEGGGERVCAEDVERVGGLFGGGGHWLDACGRL